MSTPPGTPVRECASCGTVEFGEPADACAVCTSIDFRTRYRCGLCRAVSDERRCGCAAGSHPSPSAPPPPLPARAPAPRRLELPVDDDDRRVRRVRRAERLVRVPAYGLMTTGVVGLGCAVLFVLAALGADANAPDRGSNACLAFYTAVYSGLLAYSGWQMKELCGRTWGYVAATLGVLSVLACSPCCPVGWSGFAFGVMAFNALGRPEVRELARARRDG